MDKKKENYQVISIVTGPLRSFRPKEGEMEVRAATAICESLRGPLRHSYSDGWAIVPPGEFALEDVKFIPILRRPHDDEGSFDITRKIARDAVEEALAGPRATVGDPPGLTQKLDLSRVKV